MGIDIGFNNAWDSPCWRTSFMCLNNMDNSLKLLFAQKGVEWEDYEYWNETDDYPGYVSWYDVKPYLATFQKGQRILKSMIPLLKGEKKDNEKKEDNGLLVCFKKIAHSFKDYNYSKKKLKNPKLFMKDYAEELVGYFNTHIAILKYAIDHQENIEIS